MHGYDRPRERTEDVNEEETSVEGLGWDADASGTTKLHEGPDDGVEVQHHIIHQKHG